MARFLATTVAPNVEPNQSSDVRNKLPPHPGDSQLYCFAFVWRDGPMHRCTTLFLLLGLALPAFGQSNYGVISGTVMDAQHLPIAGAAVQLTAISTGSIRHVTTNQQGLFEAPALLPDDYELKTEANGFAVAIQSVRLEVGQKLAVGINLTVVGVKEGVNVTAGNEVLRTTDASVGEVIEPQSIRELPLNGRMLIDL